jgi:hypothetical protein
MSGHNKAKNAGSNPLLVYLVTHWILMSPAADTRTVYPQNPNLRTPIEFPSFSSKDSIN